MGGAKASPQVGMIKPDEPENEKIWLTPGRPRRLVIPRIQDHVSPAAFTFTLRHQRFMVAEREMEQTALA